jgi:hypothetical protein
MELISGIPSSVIHLLFPVADSNWSSGNSRVNHLNPHPFEPSASVPHMTWRFLAGMPWTSVWQYPSNKTLVSTICLQLGQNLCPPFRVSMVKSSHLFVLLVGGGQRVFKDWIEVKLFESAEIKIPAKIVVKVWEWKRIREGGGTMEDGYHWSFFFFSGPWGAGKKISLGFLDTPFYPELPKNVGLLWGYLIIKLKRSYE